MGNTSKRGPKTDKIIHDDQMENLKYGICEMQGWRGNMVRF
jgi:hypothetical protein